MGKVNLFGEKLDIFGRGKQSVAQLPKLASS